MRTQQIFKFIFLLLILYSSHALSTQCPLWQYVIDDGEEAVEIATSETIHLNEVVNSTIVLADPINVRFWVGQCITENQIEYTLVANITPTILGKTRGVGTYDIAVIQDNKQFDGILSFTSNLYVAKDFWTGLTTWVKPSESIPYFPGTGLDLSKPFTLVLACRSDHYGCSDVNPERYIDFNPRPVYDSSTISSVSGTWYDYDYNGSGFNFVQTSSGLLMYYYGYKAQGNGETLWLISSIGPKVIKKDETMVLDVFSGFAGNGGSLVTKPTTGNSGTSKWGSAEITFTSCYDGVVKLTNYDGISVTQNIKTLARINGLSCRN